MNCNSMLSSLFMPPAGRSVSVSGENVFGAPGCGGMADPTPGAAAQEDVRRLGQITDIEQPHPARDLGVGYKIRPWIYLAPGAETPLLDTDGPGIVRHIWIACRFHILRQLIIRMYWDHESTPSVEVPLGDFFCNAQGYYGEMQSIPICVNPNQAMNCYWQMPFRKHARITVFSLEPEIISHFFYTIDFTLGPVPENASYFHASFRRTNPLGYGEDFVIADGIRGRGSYAGCYLAWQQNNNCWWGEGEVKMYIDGDSEFPSICGTGTEDYVCGAWSFAKKTFSSLYSGYHCGGDFDKAGMRHAMYRFHLPDPIWFQSDFKITVQALGWRDQRRYLPLRDDISGTAYWYQNEPHAPLPELPDRDGLEVI